MTDRSRAVKLVLAESLSESGLSAERWRARAEARWDAVRASEHYHGGLPCRATPGCQHYDPEYADTLGGDAA